MCVCALLIPFLKTIFGGGKNSHLMSSNQQISLGLRAHQAIIDIGEWAQGTYCVSRENLGEALVLSNSY